MVSSSYLIRIVLSDYNCLYRSGIEVSQGINRFTTIGVRILGIHTILSMCRVPPMALYYQERDWGEWKKGRIREDRIKQPFYTMQRINPLGSTVSITSTLYCIYRLILLLWV